MSKLKTNFELNSFYQSDIRGREDNPICTNKLSCKLILGEGETLVAGDMVKLCPDNIVGDYPTCTSVSNSQQREDTETYGFILYNTVKNEYKNGDLIVVAFNDCFVKMLASQPIACGEKVYYDNRNTAVGGFLAFNNTDLDALIAISNGSLDLNIDGSAVSLTGLDFSAQTTLAGCAGVINTKLSTNGTCSIVGGKIVIKSNTTGVSSSVSMVSTSGDVYEALGDSISQLGQKADDNNGKVVPYLGSATNGVIECGVCYTNSFEPNSLIKVKIK